MEPVFTFFNQLKKEEEEVKKGEKRSSSEYDYPLLQERNFPYVSQPTICLEFEEDLCHNLSYGCPTMNSGSVLPILLPFLYVKARKGNSRDDLRSQIVVNLLTEN